MPRFKAPILAVDDDEIALAFYETLLRHSDFSGYVGCQDSRKVADLLQKQPFSAIVLDLNMPHVSGLELLEQIQDEYPEIPIIVVTAEEGVETAVACLRAGAFDYIVKPVQKNRFLASLKHAIETRELRREVSTLSRRLLESPRASTDAFAQIVTANPGMRKLFRYVEAIAPSPIPVLITGESGTGKELFARVIHELSGLTGKLVPVNVAGLDETVFVDTLFGHKRGAYTGADTDRGGLIEEAAGGTLFLDEIGELDHGSQIKLLRLLQEGEYYPLGSDVARMCNARIIAATNADIRSRQEKGQFRQDLFYRLATYHVEVPPLRERLDDVPLLFDHFLREAASTLAKKAPTVPPDLYTTVRAYNYPGNIRELRSMVYDALTRHEKGVLSTQFFRDHVSQSGGAPAELQSPDGDRDPDDAPHQGEPRIVFSGRFPKLKEVEDLLIDEAMERAQGNQTVAAGLLGISQSTLSRRFAKKNT
jgi:DNA-binding NtrC family response regulator